MATCYILYIGGTYMYKPYDFNLQYFQQKVIEEYKELKFIKDKDEEYFKDPNKDYTDPAFNQGCLNKFVWSGFFKIIGIGEKKQFSYI